MKNYFSTLLAILSAAVIIWVARSCSEHLEQERKIEVLQKEISASPTPITQGSELRLTRNVTVETSSGSTLLSAGSWLYIQGEDASNFTCYVNGQSVQIPKSAAVRIK